MGMDIHIYLSKKDGGTNEIEFGGRNSIWFNNLMIQEDDAYNHFEPHHGVSPYLDEKIKKESEDRWYFEHHYISVGDFKEWFTKYKPNKDAGWVTTYDAWRIENQGYIPYDISHTMLEDVKIEDQHFVEIPNREDCSDWLYNYLINVKAPDDAHITYWFDN